MATNEPPFGEDPLDQFSTATETRELVKNGKHLGWLIVRPRRVNPEKPGRSLAVGFDEREPLTEGVDFRTTYTYLVRFVKQPGQDVMPAGNHYHNFKSELFSAAHGDFLVVLQDRDDPEAREEIRLSSRGNTENLVYVHAGVAHAVRPTSDGESTFLVHADHPNVQRDEFPYDVI